jgi:hypothetical protein
MQSAPFKKDSFLGKNFNYCPKTYKVINTSDRLLALRLFKKLPKLTLASIIYFLKNFFQMQSLSLNEKEDEKRGREKGMNPLIGQIHCFC